MSVQVVSALDDEYSYISSTALTRRRCYQGARRTVEREASSTHSLGWRQQCPRQRGRPRRRRNTFQGIDFDEQARSDRFRLRQHRSETRSTESKARPSPVVTRNRRHQARSLHHWTIPLPRPSLSRYCRPSLPTSFRIDSARLQRHLRRDTD